MHTVLEISPQIAAVLPNGKPDGRQEMRERGAEVFQIIGLETRHTVNSELS